MRGSQKSSQKSNNDFCFFSGIDTGCFSSAAAAPGSLTSMEETPEKMRRQRLPLKPGKLPVIEELGASIAGSKLVI